nr:uncharacterized protein LOC109173786 [Ipomoea batatas]
MVVVGPPPSGTGSQGAMRIFPVSARPPAPSTKISLGSKKADPPKAGEPNSKTSVPTGLSGEKDAARAAKRGKEKEVLEVEEVLTVNRTHRDGSGSTTPVIDMLMKHGDEPLAALLTRICAAAPPSEQTSGWSTALVGERIARDLIQNDVRAALEVLIDDDDLPKILAVLPEEVPDPGPTPFSKIPDGQALVPATGASAGPTADAAVESSAGPTAEGAADPSAEPLTEGK